MYRRMTRSANKGTVYGDLSYRIYEGRIPDEISEKLKDIYQSAYCVRDFQSIYNHSDDVKVLVLSLGQTPVHILFFSVDDEHVNILNRVYSIEGKYVDYASDAIFNEYENVVRVNFSQIYETRLSKVQSPHFVLKKYEDIILALPENFETYFNKLGRKTRHHVKQYYRRLNKAFGDVKFEIKTAGDIDAKTVKRVIMFNRLRTARKGLISYIDEDLEEKIVQFSRSCGHMGTVMINGRVLAGSIFYEVKKQVFLDIISHDPNYDKYNVGTVCLLNTIRNCIENGGQAFHMLWGTSEFKHRFLGYDKQVCDMAVFRSGFQRALDFHEFLGSVWSRYYRRATNLLFTKLSYYDTLRVRVQQIRRLYHRLARG
jgi:hypothetical protein